MTAPRTRKPRLAAERKRQLDALAAASEGCSQLLGSLEVALMQVSAGDPPDLASVRAWVADLRAAVNKLPAAFGTAKA